MTEWLTDWLTDTTLFETPTRLEWQLANIVVQSSFPCKFGSRKFSGGNSTFVFTCLKTRLKAWRDNISKLLYFFKTLSKENHSSESINPYTGYTVYTIQHVQHTHTIYLTKNSSYFFKNKKRIFCVSFVNVRGVNFPPPPPLLELMV